jgi:hypothetical protein
MHNKQSTSSFMLLIIEGRAMIECIFFGEPPWYAPSRKELLLSLFLGVGLRRRLFALSMKRVVCSTSSAWNATFSFGEILEIEVVAPIAAPNPLDRTYPRG